jgi:hypothetical protein
MVGDMISELFWIDRLCYGSKVSLNYTDLNNINIRVRFADMLVRLDEHMLIELDNKSANSFCFDQAFVLI